MQKCAKNSAAIAKIEERRCNGRNKNIAGIH